MNATLLITAVARLLLALCLTPPGNDDCAGAIEIAGEGKFLFSNTGATDSELKTECEDFRVFGDFLFHADVWYCWTADCTGFVTVDTCGSSAVDTKIGIHEGCSCSAESFLACSDNDCATQSKAEFHATEGATYGIRIGSSPGFSSAADTFRISCRSYDAESVSMCDYWAHPADLTPICKSRSAWDALNSTRGEFTVVEDYVPQESGQIRSICWAGVNLNEGQECIRHAADEFEITYYFDDCGAPGAILAGPFPGDHYGLTVEGPAMTHIELPGGIQEFEYGAQHEPVDINAKETYWISITNSSDGECGWYWETSPGNTGYAVQLDDSSDSAAVVQSDLSFCFDVHHADALFCTQAVVPNDTCDTAAPLHPGTVEFDTLGAVTEAPYSSVLSVASADPNLIALNDDFPLGDYRAHKDIWFEIQNPCTGRVRISLCDSSFDTKLAVFDSMVCPPPIQRVAHSDDNCGFENLRSFVEFSVSDAHAYKVQVGGYDGSWGTGLLEYHYIPAESSTLRDFAGLMRCFTGSCTSPCGLPAAGCCPSHDFDTDADVDLNDVESLVHALTGPQLPAIRY